MTRFSVESADLVIARTVFRIVVHSFSNGDQQERRCFRIKNLSTASIQAFLKVWAEQAASNNLGAVRVVIAGDSDAIFPEVFRADPGRSITYYRNNNEQGLIYVETKTESDEQGLRNIFTLRDNNFLDGSFDDAQFDVKREIIGFAWAELGGKPGTLSEYLERRLLDVLRLIHPRDIPVSARKFAKFVLRACQYRLDVEGALQPDATDRLVGRCLPELDMFPDEGWRSPDSDLRTARRLVLNGLHADLSSGPTTDLDPENLTDLSLKARFKDETGAEYPAPEMKQWQSLCAQYSRVPSREQREAIPYRIFEQLFAKDSKGLTLGDKVQQEIQNEAPGRVNEFLGLSVKEGLNRRLQEDAQRFLDAPVPDDGLSALRDLLKKQTRRLVERIAYPRAEPFENPIVKLTEVAGILRERSPDFEGSLTLEMRIARENQRSPSIQLFAFVYGPTLKSIMRASQDGASAIELVVADELLTVSNPPEILDSDAAEASDDGSDEEPAGKDTEWWPVAVEFRLMSKADGSEIDSEGGLEWNPAQLEWLALFWLMVAGTDRPLSRSLTRIIESVDLQEWVDEVIGRSERADSFSTPITDAADSDHLQRAVSLRDSFVEQAKTTGLDAQLLDDTFDRWETIVAEAKRDLVPHGNVDARIGALLSMDSLSLGAKGLVILPTHPIKLRWLARYLQKSEELAVKALDGELPLNRQNPKLYLDWIAGLSSIQQPPIASGSDRRVLFSTGIIGWSETYSALRLGEDVPDISLFDSLSLLEIVRQVHLYLESHPFKRDGLSILLVLPLGDSLPSQLADEIRKGEWRDTRISMNVLAPRTSWEAITTNFEKIPSDNRMSEGEELFPSLELRLHELKEGSFAEVFDDVAKVDVAIVPQFLSDKISIQENTEPSIETEGRFEPLLDDPTFVSGGISGGSIAVQMKPRAPDVAVTAWSSLAVRHSRTTPVSSQQPENTDFVELRIDFQKSSQLFSLLHERAHWVITLERHITREQIETLESKPDVLMILDGVGINGLYKIVVSSNSGREFIIARLERKLLQLVSVGRAGVSASTYRGLAAQIYEETRTLAPRLTLQATGVSRATEEILGLMIARHVAEQEFPSRPADGLVVWLALDEYTDWFRGTNAVRADFCRIVFEVVGEQLCADILVVEGKLRQGYTPHGEEQVSRTLDLFEDVFQIREDHQPLDAKLWREQLLSKIENLSPDARVPYGAFADEMTTNGHVLPQSLRNQFRDGKFKVRLFAGLFSICNHSQSGTLLKERGRDERVSIVRTFRNHLVDLLAPRAEGSQAPTQDETMVEENSPTNAVAPTSQDSALTPEQVPATELGSSGSSSPRVDHVDVSSEELEHKAEKRKLGKQELERRYQLILDKYGEFGISVQPPSDREDWFVEGPATVLYRLKPGQAVDPKRIYEKSDALKLTLELGEEQNIRFSIDQGFVTIDVPKSERDRYFVDAGDLWGRWTRPPDALATPIGEDRYGDVVEISFSSANSPHLLIGGTTGSGKSEALNTILKGLVRNYTPTELRLLLVDPKGTELQGFSGSEHLLGQIGWDEDDAKTQLEDAVQQMQSRYEKFKAKKTRSLQEFNAAAPGDEKLPWWVIVLDEYADLTSDPDAKKEIEANLKRLAQKARASGIHVIIATQKPSADVISTNLRSNLPAQLALRVKSGTESRVIMDEAGAESLNGKGDAFLKSEGRLTRVQCAKVE